MWKREEGMNRFIQGAFWIGVYLLLTLMPLFLLLIGSTPPGRSFWTEFSIAIGFAGMAIMGMQFLITARFRHINAPYGMDIMYYFHRQISWVALALVVAHPIIIFWERPEMLPLLNVFEAPWRARFAVTSTVALLALVATSVWRKFLHLQYEVWRVLHGALAVLAVGLGMAHAVMWGNYIGMPWKAAFWIALTAFWIGALAYVRLGKPVLMLRRPYRVTAVRPERGNAWTLALEPEGHTGFRFQPGQFAWLSLWNGPFGMREHPFSFSSSAERQGEVTMTIRELGDFTATVKEVRPGQRAYLDGPYGAFSVDRHRSPGYVFIAGGVGITPVMSMLRTLADRGNDQPLLLIYANSAWEDVIFCEELEELKRRLRVTIVHVLEQPPAGWPGESGIVTAEMLKRHLPADRNSRDYFICGPDRMMDAVERALTDLGVSLAYIHSERYNFV
jgi:predicted ferric reductase